MRRQPPAREIVIDGQRLAYRLTGRGDTTVVLINGAGGPMDGWFRLYPEIDSLGQVLAYDRPGAGAAGRPCRAQTGAAVVAELRELLSAVGLTPPYVLAAHSFGGLHAQLFARTHPGEVAGIVFIEAAGPDDVEGMKRLEAPLARGLNGLLNRFARRDPLDEVSQEAETAAQIRAAAPFPDVPVVVLSGGKRPPAWLSPADALAQREANQQALARLSPRGRRLIAGGSGHFPQISQPEEVLAAIRLCLEGVDRLEAAGARGVFE